MMKKIEIKKNYPLILLSLFLIILLISGISPNYRNVWLSEHIVTVFVLGILILTYKKFQFSNLSYTLIFVFLVMNTIGSHYSYSEVPMFEWIKEAFDLSRNHYDRLAHFMYGLTFYFPIYEFISKKLKVRGIWAHLVSFLIIIGTKGLYEILEFASIFFSSADTSTGFLGMQGDVWDAQKDMLLGGIGALVSGILIRLNTRKK